jgi:hypothetical protein
MIAELGCCGIQTAANTSAIAYALLLYLVLLVIPGGVTLLKGHYLLFVIGFLLLGLIWTIASLRLARPSSWWARRFYGEEKLARASRRYGPPEPP